jgi:amidase
MDAADLAFTGVVRQAELVRAGEVAPRELVETYLERIDRLDPQLNAFRIVYGERALAEADQAAARRKAGEERPLLGVPLAIKDNTDIAGDVTPNGSRAHGGPATEDAEVVKRVRAAGAIVIGKTHVSELCIFPWGESGTFGVSRNPWSLEHGTGGSSAGSGAAVAAGLVPAALGSDGAGSVRIPATVNGLFGLKPQRGRISLRPYAEHWHGLSAYGWLTRRVLDAALMLDATAGPAAGDAHTPPPPERSFLEAARAAPARLRVALAFNGPPGLVVRLDDRWRRAALETADALRALGHDVEEVEFDYGMSGPRIIARFLRGISDDAAAVAHPDRLDRRTKGMARAGAAIPRSVLERARAAEDADAARINRVFDDHDVVLTPALARPHLRLGACEGRGALVSYLVASGYTPYTPIWNHTGQPAASFPAGFTDDGLPLAVQLVARPNDESLIFSLAAQLEAERPWADRRPPVS